MRVDWEAGSLHADAFKLQIDEQLVRLLKVKLINGDTIATSTCVEIKIKKKQQGVKKLLSGDQFTLLYEDLISETN